MTLLETLSIISIVGFVIILLYTKGTRVFVQNIWGAYWALKQVVLDNADEAHQSHLECDTMLATLLESMERLHERIELLERDTPIENTNE